jgi:hypothetical protein
MLPYKGMKENGVKGLFRGLGIGLLGVIFKPIGGVLDFPAKVMEGTLNSLGRGSLVLTRLHSLVRTYILCLHSNSLFSTSKL